MLKRILVGSLFLVAGPLWASNLPVVYPTQGCLSPLNGGTKAALMQAQEKYSFGFEKVQRVKVTFLGVVNGQEFVDSIPGGPGPYDKENPGKKGEDWSFEVNGIYNRVYEWETRQGPALTFTHVVFQYQRVGNHSKSIKEVIENMGGEYQTAFVEDKTWTLYSIKGNENYSSFTSPDRDMNCVKWWNQIIFNGEYMSKSKYGEKEFAKNFSALKPYLSKSTHKNPQWIEVSTHIEADYYAQIMPSIFKAIPGIKLVYINRGLEHFDMWLDNPFARLVFDVTDVDKKVSQKAMGLKMDKMDYIFQVMAAHNNQGVVTLLTNR